MESSRSQLVELLSNFLFKKLYKYSENYEQLYSKVMNLVCLLLKCSLLTHKCNGKEKNKSSSNVIKASPSKDKQRLLLSLQSKEKLNSIKAIQTIKLLRESKDKGKEEREDSRKEFLVEEKAEGGDEKKEEGEEEIEEVIDILNYSVNALFQIQRRYLRNIERKKDNTLKHAQFDTIIVFMGKLACMIQDERVCLLSLSFFQDMLF